MIGSLRAYYDELNDNQRFAAMHRQGRALVSAGAGTGKTRTLVARYLALLLDEQQPVQAREILTITYTNVGANEIKHRVREDLIALGCLEHADQMNQAWISTIHGFCSRILRRYSLEAGIDPYFKTAEDMQVGALQAQALDELFWQLTSLKGEGTNSISSTSSAENGRLSRDDYLVLRETWSDYSLRAKTIEVYESLRRAGLRRFDLDFATKLKALPVGEVWTPSAIWKQMLLVDDQVLVEKHPTPSTLLMGCVVEFARIYERLCTEHSLLDYNELLLLTRELLRDEQILRDIKSQFTYVMVDEAQDSNALQMEIISEVAGDNLYQVGDSKQSIYGFQGADVSVMQAFQDSFDAQGAQYELVDNYRSDESVLAFANALFGNDELLGFPATALRAHEKSYDNPELSRGVKLADITAKDVGVREGTKLCVAAEAQWIAGEFRAEHERGRSWSDFVVLVAKRSHAKELQKEFEHLDIPVLLRGGDCLLNTEIVKDARLLIDMICKPRDPELFLKCLLSSLGRVSDQGIYELGSLRRKLGLDFLWDAALAAVQDSVLSDEQDRLALRYLVQSIERGRLLLGSRPLSEIVARAFGERDVDLAYLSRGTLAGRQAMANLQQFLGLIDSWQANGNDILSFTSELEKQQETDLYIQQEIVSLQGEECVIIDTIHSSKGLEYKVVALPLAASLNTKADKESITVHQLTFGQSLELAETAEPQTGQQIGLQAGDCLITRRDSSETAPYNSAHYEEFYLQDKQRKQLEANRLLYVACTRAKEMMLISYNAGNKGDGLSGAMTRGMKAANAKMKHLQERGHLTLESLEVGKTDG